MLELRFQGWPTWCDRPEDEVAIGCLLNEPSVDMVCIVERQLQGPQLAQVAQALKAPRLT